MSLNVTAALYGEILKEEEGGFEERVNDAKKFMDWFFYKTGVERNVKDAKIFVAGGTGRYAIAAAEMGVKDISHMDLSEENVRRIQGISDQNNYGIKSIQGNLMDLDLENEYDLIVSEGVIQHLPDPGLGLQKISKCLKSNGSFFFSIYRYGTLSWTISERLRKLHSPADFNEMIDVLGKLSLYDRPIAYSHGTFGRWLLDVLYVPQHGTYAEQQVADTLEESGLSVTSRDNLPALHFSLPTHKTLYFIAKAPEDLAKVNWSAIKVESLYHDKCDDYPVYVNELIDELDAYVEKYKDRSALEKAIFSIGVLTAFDECWRQALFEEAACNRMINYLKKYCG